MSDEINHPDHYTIGGIETIDYMKAKSTREEYLGFLKLSILGYISRAGFKGEALKDFKKAKWYLNRLIKELEEPDCLVLSGTEAEYKKISQEILDDMGRRGRIID